VGRIRVCRKERDFEAFEEIIAPAKMRRPMWVFARCAMSNRWHFVLWPRGAGVGENVILRRQTGLS